MAFGMLVPLGKIGIKGLWVQLCERRRKIRRRELYLESRHKEGIPEPAEGDEGVFAVRLVSIGG